MPAIQSSWCVKREDWWRFNFVCRESAFDHVGRFIIEFLLKRIFIHWICWGFRDESRIKANILYYIADFDNRYFRFLPSDPMSETIAREGQCGVGRAYKNVKHAWRRSLFFFSLLESRKSWLFVDGRALEVNSRVNWQKRIHFSTLSAQALFHPPDQCFCLSPSLFNFVSFCAFFWLRHMAVCKATDWVNVCTLRRLGECQLEKCKMGGESEKTWIIQWFWKGH